MPDLSALEAASLAAAFAQDTVNNALRVVPDVLVAYTPADGRALLASLLPAGLRWLKQQGADLGARLAAASAHAAACGHTPFVVIGTDSPTLPSAHIKSALDALSADTADVVLGPTTDGGYYLVGLRRPVERLFQNVAWSTPLAYEQTARNATALGLRLLALPAWYDVDTFDDLLRLRDELNSDKQARLRAPTTYRWLRAHDL